MAISVETGVGDMGRGAKKTDEFEETKEALRSGGACHAVRDYIAHFANPVRLNILCELFHKEASVNELVAAAGVRQPTVSQQLNNLRLAGVVARRRSGNSNVYRIVDPLAEQMMEFIFSLAVKLNERSARGGAGAC
jgi:DNA-binding transcriptional ArsR family regulator